MVQFLMGVVHTQRVFLRGDVVPQHQIQLKLSVPHPGDGGDGVVGLTVGLREHKGRLVRIAPPCGEDAVCQFYQTLIVPAAEPDHGHGPLDDARLHILKVPEGDGPLNGGLLHGKGVAAALEMVMAQNGAAHDRKICVAAHKVVGELLNEVQQLAEGSFVDLHRGMMPVQNDAVLVIVDVGAVLEEPVLLIDGNGDDPVVLPGGMVEPSRVALVFPAKLALGITGLRCRLCRRDGLGVLLRLGEVNGDVQLPVGGGRLPLHIPCDAVAPDVVRVLTEAVKPVRGVLRASLIPPPELADDLRGPGRQPPHQLRVKEIPVRGIILDPSPGRRVIQQLLQDVLQGALMRFRRLLPCIHPHSLQQLVHRPRAVIFIDQSRAEGVAHQVLDGLVTHASVLLIPI